MLKKALSVDSLGNLRLSVPHATKRNKAFYALLEEQGGTIETTVRDIANHLGCTTANVRYLIKGHTEAGWLVGSHLRKDIYRFTSLIRVREAEYKRAMEACA